MSAEVQLPRFAVLNPTARELLAELGAEHAMDTLISQERTANSIRLTCSCGDRFLVVSTPYIKAALRNVPLAGQLAGAK
jgi:hypothetical protein